MGTRKGKHRDGNVRIGIYVTPIRKAVAVYLADLTDSTLTDILWEGIKTVAQRHGVILQDGETIAEDHRAAIETAIAIIKSTNNVKG